MTERAFDLVGYPVRDDHHREPIPDLSRVAPRRWVEVLRPLSPAARRAALGTVPAPDAAGALALVGWLEAHGDPAPWTAPAPASAPAAAAAPSFSGQRRTAPARRRQLNLRLSEDDHRLLAQAAEATGLRPTQLVRMFTRQGAIRMLLEEDALRRTGHRPAT